MLQSNRMKVGFPSLQLTFQSVVTLYGVPSLLDEIQMELSCLHRPIYKKDFYF